MAKNFKIDGEHKKNNAAKWEKELEKNLKGRPATSLNFRTDDGIALKPIYDDFENKSGEKSGDVGAAPFVRGGGRQETGQNPWTILQLIDFTSQSKANEQIERDMEGGADGFLIRLGSGVPFPGSTLSISHYKDFEILFEDMNPEGMVLHFEGGLDLIPKLAMFKAFAKKHNLKGKNFKGNLGLDPISIFAAHNLSTEPMGEALTPFVDTALGFDKDKFGLVPFKASSRPWHQAGASAAQELGLTLAAAISYLRALNETGVPLEKAADMIDFSLSVGSNLFFNIAKFRSLRGLWSHALEQCGIAARPAVIHGEMSVFETSRLDPQVNMLRGTSATVAASLGGANSMVVVPYTSHFGIAKPHARRVARNTQLIAAHESNLGAVQDAAGGAWYVENLTQKLAEKAWGIFQKIEQQGGLLRALDKGEVYKMIDEVRQSRSRNFALGKVDLIGATIFPNLEEDLPEFDEPHPPTEGQAETVGIDLKPVGTGAWFEGLVSAASQGAGLLALTSAIMRPLKFSAYLPRVNGNLSESFEELRRMSDMALADYGARPTVYLVTAGCPGDYTARATWVCGFFEAGGIAVELHQGGDDVKSIVTGFENSDAPVAVIASSDAIYEERLEEVLAALQGAECQYQFVVARPELLGKLPGGAVPNIGSLLYQGVNRLAILAEVYDMFGFLGGGMEAPEGYEV